MNPQMLAVAAAIVALVTVAAAPAHGDELLRRAKLIETPSIGGDALVAVQLDSDVYATAADGYSDLRVLGPSRQEIPYVIRTVTKTERAPLRQSTRVADPAVRPLPNDGLEMTFAGDKDGRGALPDRLVIVTPLKDFEHRVTVAWSSDGRDWKPLVEDAVIYDYSRFMDVRDLSIHLPEPPGRGGQYRLVIDSVTQAQASRLTELTRTLAGGAVRESQEKTIVDRRPFRIDGIELWRTTEVAARKMPVLSDVRPSAFRVTRDPVGRSTRVTVETRREPISEFAITTTSRNFSRRVTIQEPSSVPGGLARTIATDTVTLIDIAGVHRSDLSVPLPETRAATYEFVIDDGDSPPIDVTGVTASGPVREVMFLAEVGVQYRLAYGGSAVARQYDTVAIDAAIDAGAVAVPATLGDEVAMPDEPQPAPKPIPLYADARFQLAVIAGLVVVLAVTLFRAAKRIGPLDEPGDHA